MACTTKQQSIPLMDRSESIKRKEKRISGQTELYDEESRKFRKYLAQREALRQLEQMKARALTSSRTMSFIR
ncbi:MAG: hypothetical protein ACXAB5_07690 [Candidatus Thorarchaeota archaeon]|jgi:hypothetical protein